MTKLPEGKTRLDLVREGMAGSGINKRGRLVVSIDKLREDAHNERKTFRNMEGLIASIKAVGLIEPITVTPERGGGGGGGGGTEETYRIITGHRRYRACKAAGLEMVEVLIREEQDEPLRRRKSIISNVQREDVGPVEMAEALQSLMDEDEEIQTQDDLARAIGKDKTWVSGMLRILSLPADVQQQVGCTQLAVSYDSMIRIARLDNAPEQRELIEALVSGATQGEIRERIALKTGKPTTGSAKPKRVYHTAHRAIIIIQATTAQPLTVPQCVAALKEALKQARQKK